MIDLYLGDAAATRALAIALEEMALAWRAVTDCDDADVGRQAPVLRDPASGVRVGGRGAGLLYLAGRTGRFLPTTHGRRAGVMEWLFWHEGVLAPVLGELDHIVRCEREPQPLALARHQDRAVRLLARLDHVLAQRAFIAGSYSVADMALFASTLEVRPAIEALADRRFAHIERWEGAIGAKASVGRALFALPQRAGMARARP